MHFTKSQIQEIAERLTILNKKDSDFSPAELPLSTDLSDEKFPIIQYFPILQDYENRLLALSDIVNLLEGHVDLSAVGCILTVTCSTSGATITIRNKAGQSTTISSGGTYTCYYGDVLEVTVSKTGYDSFYESVTMTQDHTLAVALNPATDTSLDQSVADLQAAVLALQQALTPIANKVNGISLVDNGSYHTLTVGSESVDIYPRESLYTKSQIDDMLASINTEDGTTVPDAVDLDDAYLSYEILDSNGNKTDVFVMDSDGNSEQPAPGVDSNIPGWIQTGADMPNEEDAQTNPEDNAAVNFPEEIIVFVGASYEIVESI